MDAYVDVSADLPSLYPILRRYARLYVRGEEVEELVQEVLCKMVKDRQSHPDATYNRSWFFRVLKNFYFQEYRKSNRRSRAGFTSVGDELLSFLPGLDNPEGPLELKEVLEAIEELPEHYRDTLKLVAGGAPYDEVAQELGIPIGTVMSRMLRARKALKSRLEKAPT